MFFFFYLNAQNLFCIIIYFLSVILPINPYEFLSTIRTKCCLSPLKFELKRICCIVICRISFEIGEYYMSAKDYEKAIKSYKEATYYNDSNTNVSFPKFTI